MLTSQLLSVDSPDESPRQECRFIELKSKSTASPCTVAAMRQVFVPTCQPGPCCEPCQPPQQPLLGPQHASESYTERCTAPAELGSGVYTCPASAAHPLRIKLNVGACVLCLFTTLLQQLGQNGVHVSGVRTYCLIRCISIHTDVWIFLSMDMHLFFPNYHGVERACYTFNTMYTRDHMHCVQDLQGRMCTALCLLQCCCHESVAGWV